MHDKWRHAGVVLVRRAPEWLMLALVGLSLAAARALLVYCAQTFIENATMATDPPPHAVTDAAPATAGFYHALSPRVLLAGGAGRWALILGWLLSLGASLWLGVLQLYGGWYGFQVKAGELTFLLSIYPPLTISTLWVLCFGYAWGASLAYLTTFMVGLLSGLSPGWAMVFGLANPLGLLVMALVYQQVRVSFIPRSLAALMFFVSISFVSGIASATGSFIWSYYNKLSALGAFQAWQGWWAGNFLQTVTTCAPLLYLFGPRLLRWRERHWPSLATEASYRWVWLAALSSLAGVIAFLWLSFVLADRSVMAMPGAADQQWQQRALLYRDSARSVYWVMSVLLFAMVFLGYRFLTQRTRQLRQSATRLAQQRDLALRRQQEAETARNELHQLNMELAARILEVEGLQAQLREQANRDPLTGLHNRRYLHQHLPALLQSAQQQQRHLCVLLLDLDHFKLVNDRHGHAAGDAVLRLFAAQLAAMAGPGDLLVRYGGEEFLLVLPAADEARVGQLLQQLQATLDASQLRVDSGTLAQLSFSAGVTFGSGRQDSEDDLLLQADAALYQAKAAGRRTWRVYQP